MEVPWGMVNLLFNVSHDVSKQIPPPEGRVGYGAVEVGQKAEELDCTNTVAGHELPLRGPELSLKPGRVGEARDGERFSGLSGPGQGHPVGVGVAMEGVLDTVPSAVRHPPSVSDRGASALTKPRSKGLPPG